MSCKLMHQFMVLSSETHNYPLLREDNGKVVKEISAPNGDGHPPDNVCKGGVGRGKDCALIEAMGEREKVAVMVMGKMRDTGRMVVKDSKTGESLEVVRKVTFNPAIHARTVTVEGDVFEPSGIVEGGSRRRGAPVLSLLSKANKVRGELDAKERELDASSRELSEMRKRTEKYRSAKSALELALHNLEVLEKAEGEEYEKVKREASEKKKEARRQSEELRGLEKALEACASKRVRVEGVLKQNGVKKARSDEESEVGKEGGDYDFKHVKMEEVHSRVVALEEEQEQLGRRLNKKVLGMMEKAESEYEELLKKREIIEKDKSQIEELDVKKKETLATTYAKVNRDFGSIFSTLLPDASARLEPSNGNVLEGLEVRVAFGGKEKESLSELSGGQRSLLALSLLLFKPAPMYILDEVDAALDLSHTQNIGRMLRKHFGQSQFIVVSLKEGMFTNANVLFRTKFVDGVSTVTRTVGQVEEVEEED
ncbi:hypothetical protein WA556_004927, partial [Blastocystis sp. ATCC 50177/Nand II]